MNTNGNESYYNHKRSQVEKISMLIGQKNVDIDFLCKWTKTLRTVKKITTKVTAQKWVFKTTN